MTDTHGTAGERRHFLWSAAAAGRLLVVKSETVFGTQANAAIELGLIGCGSRGNWIGGHFVEYTGARIVALADVFAENLASAQTKFKVDSTRLHKGLRGYRKLAESKLDAAVIETPPYFHPKQAAAAVDACKHVFLAKPVAVDAPGCRSIVANGEKAKGKLSFLVDFQTRARAAFQEAAARVHRGEIVVPVMAPVFYHTGRLAARGTAGLSADPAQIRNWFFDNVLSGDIIVEQNVHVTDVADWFLQSHPMKACGPGGVRNTRRATAATISSSPSGTPTRCVWTSVQHSSSRASSRRASGSTAPKRPWRHITAALSE